VCGAGIQGAEGAQAHAAKTGVHVCVCVCVCVCVRVRVCVLCLHAYTHHTYVIPIRRASKFCREQVNTW
jgi:hypothetical protein